MRKTLSKCDKILLVIIIVFLIFGSIMVLSASSMESYMRYSKSPYYYFFKHIIFVVVGLFIYFVLHFIPTKVYKKLYIFFMIIPYVMMIGLIIYGKSAREAVSWFKIGPFSIQPSEFAKVFTIIYLAGHYDKYKDNLTSQWTIFRPLLVVVVLASLIALQPDLGTSLILVIMTIMVFYAVPISKEKRKYFNRIFIGGILLVVLLLISTKGTILRDYQIKRLYSFIYNPCERYQDEEGYQLCNSYIAFYNGGVTGKGVGESTQKYLYLPDSYTDFIFPIIIEEWGMIVGVVIILGYGIVLFRIFKIAKRARNLGNGLIAYGVFSYIFVHIAVNLIGVMGLGPLTGVPLPFLSYGGSYTWSVFIALGILQRVCIENNKSIIKNNMIKGS